MKFFSVITKLAFAYFCLFSTCVFSKASQKIEKVTFLGVSASTLPEAMSEQLKLPKGIHLSIDQVSPDSPADQAGVKLYDILLQMDDQTLVNSDQLKALVRMKSNGDRVKLKILRKGSPMLLDVTLSETSRRLHDQKFEPQLYQGQNFPFESPINKNFNQLFRNHNSSIQDLLKSHGLSQVPGISNLNFKDNTLIDPDHPIHGSTNDDIKSFSYSSQQNFTTITDEEGTLEFSQKDGSKFLKFTNPNGEIIFEGSIDNDEQIEKLPSFIREKLKKITQPN